jgi:hypothetical protein
MNILLDAICRAGLNRGGIRDALYGLERYKGVTGEMVFDPNAKNIAPLYLGKVKDGRIAYRRYTMDKPYATVGERGVEYNGPPVADAAGPKPTIGVFGPAAETAVVALREPGYRIVGVSSEAAWGKASTELVNLFYDPSTIGLVATDRASAHLAEQIAVKTFLPVIALSADRKLTSTNIPWIFRLAPETPLSDAVRCLAEAVEKAGPNRAKVRDYLASGRFGSTGELR